MQQHLHERSVKGNLRRLFLEKEGIDFYSNDYLGLARNEQLAQKIEENYQNLPQKKIGATGSRLLSGNSPLAMEVEDFLAHFFQGEAALLFQSGFSANTSLLSAVALAKDAILYDELSHASLKEGCRLSLAPWQWSFRHNDIDSLRQKIQLARRKGAQQVFVVVESVYSMDGDIAPLEELAALCQECDAALVVDEAHSTGIWGNHGSGFCTEKKLHDLVFARVHTFGKAVGCHGACVVGSRVLIDYLLNFARGFIYTTAMPLHSVLTLRECLTWIAQYPNLRTELFDKIDVFRSACNEYGLKIVVHPTPIQIIPWQGNQACREAAEHLIQNGFSLRPILSPTVPVGKERLRICLHQYNTASEIRSLVECIARISPNFL